METRFIDECTDRARALFAGRSVVIAGFPLAGATRVVRFARDLGAARVLVVATGIGTGPLPEPDDAESVVVTVDAPDMIGEIRATEQILASPPPEFLTALDRFDPNRDALVLIAAVEAANRLGDRPAYGPRRPEWVALEDKTTCDALFDSARVPRPPNRIVPADHTALRSAAAALDAGSGTIWAGDAREGFNGGGTFVRWVRGDDDGAEAAAYFAEHCDCVRVAPFVDGISCSVHGFVTDDGVAVFRPVELVNLRRPTGDRFQYAGCATFWDPAPADREAMRAAARRLGERLRESVDYRGCFTLDGIMGADGFVATECNPRWGAGLGYLRVALPELPFDALQYLAAAGDAAWLRAADLEAVVTDAGDRVRWGGGWTGISTRVDETRSEPVVHEASGFRAARAEEPADAIVTIGPGATGGFLRIELDRDRTPAGPSVGPRVVDAFAFADAAHGAGIGELTAPAAAR